MKFTGPSLAAASLAIAGLVAAQEVQSKPFKLLIVSEDEKLNGQAVQSCHCGAAIESLCLGYGGATLYANTTSGEESQLKGYTPPAVLVWNLPSEPSSMSESMSFYIDPSTNVALPLFEPSYNQQLVSFDDKGYMVIIDDLNDTTNPVNGDDPRALSRWYVCETYFESYRYQTLNWVLGIYEPENPTCSKVEVKRKFT